MKKLKMKQSFRIAGIALLGLFFSACGKEAEDISMVSVESITLNKEEMMLVEGETATLIATISPDHATEKTVVWKSSNPTVATVDESGKVTAMKIGTTEIIAASKKGDKTATCKLIVKKMKLALACVAEYNLSSDGKTFTKSHKNDASGYFSWDNAVLISAAFGDWHLPTIYEWNGIFSDHIDYGSLGDAIDDVEVITINGINKTYSAKYKSSAGKTYALRFLKTTNDIASIEFPAAEDNQMLCAFRYEPLGTFDYDSSNSHLKVTCRYLGKTFRGTLEDVSNENYWKTNNENDITRVFPACGTMYAGVCSDFGVIGTYWSATEIKYDSDVCGGVILFDKNGVNNSYAYIKTYCFPIRLFSNDQS